MPIEVPERDRCPFCNYVAGRGQSAIVEEGPDTLAFLPARQTGLGHVLVIPRRHAPTVLDLESDEAAAVMRHVHRLAQAITKAFDPAGLNIFQNNGLTAGQTVPHYHVHIVPSYPGDPPGKIFRSEDFERVPYDELLRIAARIAEHLPLPSLLSQGTKLRPHPNPLPEGEGIISLPRMTGGADLA